MRSNQRTTIDRSRAAASRLRYAAAVAAALACCCAPLLAQASAGDKSTSLSKVERKNKAKVSKEVLRVKLPKPMEVTLDNGVTVLILEDHRFPVVNAELEISGAGPLYEPSNMPGV